MNIKVFVSKMYSDEMLIEVDGKTPTFEQTQKAIMLINKVPEMLEMLKWFTNEFKDVYHQGTEIDKDDKDFRHI